VRYLASLLIAGVVAGCSTPGQSPGSTASAIASSREPTPAVSVLCDYFGKPQDLVIDSYIQDLRSQGGLDFKNPGPILRNAIERIQDLANRAPGKEKDDLSAFADRLDEAALDADYARVQEVSDAFFAKFHEQCGED
jgi:hypothetical protein